MELHPYTTDLAFARRSARYLADSGCTPRQIHRALIEQLDLSEATAGGIVEMVASIDALAA